MPLTRRELILAAGVTTLGAERKAFAMTTAETTAENIEAAKPKSPFRYGLNTSTLRGHKLPIVQVIEIASKAGYDAIEVWIDEIDKYVADGGKLPDLKKRIADSGLTVEGAIGFPAWLVDDDVQRAGGVKEARRNMELLQQIGGKRMAAPAVGATDKRMMNLHDIAARYRVLLDMGDQYGVVPQVEVWGFSQTLTHLGEAAFVAIESGHPDACVLADVYHLYKGGSPITGLALLNGAAMHVMHVNDYPLEPRETITDAHRVYPGDGKAPLDTIFQTLHKTGFRGVLSLELFNAEYYKQDPLQVAKTGLAKTRAAVEKALKQ